MTHVTVYVIMLSRRGLADNVSRLSIPDNGSRRGLSDNVSRRGLSEQFFRITVSLTMPYRAG